MSTTIFFKYQITGLYLNCAMSSRGIQASGGMGREMAKLISENYTDIDMFTYDLKRFQKFYVGDDTWRKESVHESELRSYWAKVPTLQRLAGRNLRFSPLHEKLLAKGAFFGQAGGFERPMFFLENETNLQGILG